MYVNLLKKIFAKTPVKKEIAPKILQYGPNGWSFGGQWFGSDEEAAKLARDKHYDKK